ncbi:MAG: AI-2E family transporter [Clostridia bacterium]|nr:AI-2E family transporter [Clostridia bacterium]
MKNNTNENESEIKERVVKRPKWVIWLFLALLCALLIANTAGGIVRDLFNGLLSGLFPIIFALVLSFLFLRPMAFIENKLLKNWFVGNPKAARYKRAISLTILFGILLLIFVLIVVLLVPSLVQSLTSMQGDELTKLIDKLQTSLTSIVQSITGIPEAQLDSAFTDAIARISVAVSDWFSDLLNNITTYLLDTFSIILSFVMGMIITFLLLKDKELISKTAKRMTYAYHSRKNAEEIITITRRTNEMLNQFVISNLIIMFIIFAIAWVGFEIIGVKFAFLMALILGLLAIIPYLGGFIASVPLAIVTLMYGDTTTMLIAVAFGILDWALVTTFVPAIIMSKRMNTRAILIILGLTIGGAMFGVVGMILSAPVVAVISTVWQERLKIRESNKEHEELVEAGLVDAQYFGVTEILDLTQDTSYNVPIEEYEDDFKRLQAEKYLAQTRKAQQKIIEEAPIERKKTVKPKSINTEE